MNKNRGGQERESVCACQCAFTNPHLKKKKINQNVSAPFKEQPLFISILRNTAESVEK